MKKDPNKYPRGWNAARVKRVAEYYERQTDDEAAAEIEAAFGKGGTMMRVPRALVPVVRVLIQKHRKRRGRQ